MLKAHVGDRVVINSRHLDEPVRDGQILEVHGADAQPPYVVEWSDNGHQALVFPGPDAHIAPPPQTGHGHAVGA